MPDELNPPAPPDPPSSSARCPECACEFDGQSITHASDTLAALREENAAVKQELAAEKQKHVVPAPPEPVRQPDPQPQPQAKKRTGMLYGKRAAA